MEPWQFRRVDRPDVCFHIVIQGDFSVQSRVHFYLFERFLSAPPARLPCRGGGEIFIDYTFGG